MKEVEREGKIRKKKNQGSEPWNREGGRAHVSQTKYRHRIVYISGHMAIIILPPALHPR